eukprot:CAMPEP_0171761946 /NCGR_PEP_ID=MMETSP0991-20121206/48370_1 /TAXON_ID=483369 /ORGANISM="non described non described, Strain CCMP2098" /LENGTH=250 /DNA_ID=CAMNT_0012365329 /DNA_START=59 /DNA_END=813 /DNA_ORIENTATION=+
MDQKEGTLYNFQLHTYKGFGHSDISIVHCPGHTTTTIIQAKLFVSEDVAGRPKNQGGNQAPTANGGDVEVRVTTVICETPYGAPAPSIHAGAHSCPSFTAKNLVNGENKIPFAIAAICTQVSCRRSKRKRTTAKSFFGVTLLRPQLSLAGRNHFSAVLGDGVALLHIDLALEAPPFATVPKDNNKRQAAASLGGENLQDCEVVGRMGFRLSLASLVRDRLLRGPAKLAAVAHWHGQPSWHSNASTDGPML